MLYCLMSNLAQEARGSGRMQSEGRPSPEVSRANRKYNLGLGSVRKSKDQTEHRIRGQARSQSQEVKQKAGRGTPTSG